MSNLLLTGTIDPSKFNNTMTTLTDVHIRLYQYETAIEWWICKSNFQNIIFIENSGFPFDVQKYTRLAEQNNKRFEYILGIPYVEETIAHGKSYGEIKLISEAIEKSMLLKSEKSFYKCTGRLIIKNVNRILRTKYKSDTVFTGVPADKWAFTCFFSVNRDFYQKYLSDAYEYVDDQNGIYMENVYYKRLLEHRDIIDTFSVYPNVDGVSAGTNSQYHSGKLRLIYKNIQMKKGFFGI